MKKLLLVNPMGRRSGMSLSKISTLPPLSLAYVAAVTPPNWEVKIWDENFTPFKFEEADLMGITAFSSNINRAYELAEIYRKKKIKVIFGGIHASMLRRGLTARGLRGSGGCGRDRGIVSPRRTLKFTATLFTIIWGGKRLLGGWFNPPAGNDRGVNKPSGIPDIP